MYRDGDDWQRQFSQAQVHVQWDPERSLRGVALGHKTIQVGLSRHVVDRYVRDWVVEIRDHTPLVRKLHGLVQSGQAAKAKPLLPKEAGKKGLPLIGALIGGLSDAYLMSRILHGAKLIYHKRYLFEKEERISRLKKPRGLRGKSKETTNAGKAARLPKRREPKS